MLTISLAEICKFTTATPSTRNMREGQQVINSGLLIMCGATEKNGSKVDLYGLCLKTSGLSSDPHVITGTVLVDDNDSSEGFSRVVISKMDCSCKAGSSRSCKHIVAVLLYCNRNNLLNLELVSSADKRCLWKQYKEPALDQFKALSCENFCCMKPDRLPPLPSEKLTEIRRRLIDCDDRTAIAKYSARVVSSQKKQNVLRDMTNSMPLRAHTSASSLDSFTKNVEDKLEDRLLRIICLNATKSTIISKLESIELLLEECCENFYSTLNIREKIYETALITKNSRTEWMAARQFRIAGSRCYNLYTYAKNDWPEKARKYF